MSSAMKIGQNAGRAGYAAYAVPETQQKALTQATVTSLGQMDVAKAIDDLEMEYPTAYACSESGLLHYRSHGPFGVLFPSPEPGPPTAPPPALSQDISFNDTTHRPAQKVGAAALERAPELLRYFKQNAVPFSYAVRRTFTPCPWENVHLPAAERAYAQVLLHGTSTYAELSLLYSALAISCFEIVRTDKFPGHSCGSLGAQYKESARQHLERAIQAEMVPHMRNKYKSLLMALLSMTLLEIKCAQYDDAEHLLLEAEYLIRTRGLSKPQKTLKVRILHHVYTYLRIMTESTCGCPMRNIHPVRPTSISSLGTAESQQTLRSFRLAKESTESDIYMRIIKNDTVAHDDIHLEVPGQWRASLFPQLYGLPEDLLALLSQVIRLANEQELMRRDTPIDGSTVAHLARSTKTLEHRILSWQPSQQGQRDRTSSSPETGSVACVDSCLEGAFHQAIILLYYRRIQNVNAMMLQDVVRRVLAYLSKECGPHEAASLLWPAFLAACEAVDMAFQDEIRDWLRAMETQTCLPTFGAVLDTAAKVWSLREKRQDYTLSWFDATSTGRVPIVAI
ncbi:hypothetical protein NLG97_g7707 [Lecanicillium saksenae]|uniref:Uncharacterized protein n=1 Tax=Lecanicillium saksenae TaxID=468837 RepID=A0ACC1QNL2_9HYPO|nr:hypothetical protein NLG97_g7707 [Lecanicillium saksenae]